VQTQVSFERGADRFHGDRCQKYPSTFFFSIDAV